MMYAGDKLDLYSAMHRLCNNDDGGDSGGKKSEEACKKKSYTTAVELAQETVRCIAVMLLK